MTHPPLDTPNIERAVPGDDRGLAYGDGLFETLASFDGRIRFLDAHLERLWRGANVLGIPLPDRADVASRLTAAARELGSLGWVKLMVTRGSGGRGYRPTGSEAARLLVSCGALKAAPARWRLKVCEQRVGDLGALNGLKHLNRLPQVVAARELSPEEEEGIMLDAAGALACGTMSNLFIVRDDAIVTPDHSQVAVRGVMREFVLRADVSVASRPVVPVSDRLWPDELLMAKEVFVTNALRGIVSVSKIDERTLPGETPVADTLRTALERVTPRC